MLPPFQKGAEMLRLKDPILTESPPLQGIDLPPLREPESLEMPTPYIAPGGATVMTSSELTGGGSAAIPPSPGFNRFGQRVSHMTDRFVLSASREAYRIFRFRSAEAAIEFPATEQGWALAWSKFRELEIQPA
jgi:hypothetical protein